jgi:hypothetical protein
MLNTYGTPDKNTQFTITFGPARTAQAVCVAATADPLWIAERFYCTTDQPAIFISGGAGNMTPEDQRQTQLILEAIARFAEEQKAVVITGGTEAGVMHQIGKLRQQHRLQFPLIGVAPLGKVAYPGYTNPDKEANLDPGHSHFVLVIGDEWGDESELIVRLTHTLAGGTQPTVGILINGGKIARNEVYLATTKDLKLPMIVLEGSGRFADELATAVRSGKTDKRILQAIVAGGDIRLVGTSGGPARMREMLTDRFKQFQSKNAPK